MVYPEKRTMLFLNEGSNNENSHLNKPILNMFTQNFGISTQKIYEIYEDLEIKEVLYKVEKPLFIKKYFKNKNRKVVQMDFPIAVSVGSIEDENPRLLHQLSKLTENQDYSIK